MSKKSEIKFDSSKTYSEKELMSGTVINLKEYLKARNIKFPSSANKADIIAIIISNTSFQKCFMKNIKKLFKGDNKKEEIKEEMKLEEETKEEMKLEKETKICRDCKIELPLSEYYAYKNNKYRINCKKCYNKHRNRKIDKTILDLSSIESSTSNFDIIQEKDFKILDLNEKVKKLELENKFLKLELGNKIKSKIE